MARYANRPQSREEFKEYILRKLGAPVIEVELADVQLDDVIDDAVEVFNQFHHDGAFRTYRKEVITRQMIEENKKIPSFHNNADASDTSPLYDASQGSFEGEVGFDASNDLSIDASGFSNSNYTEYGSGILVPDDIIGVTRVFRLAIGGNSANWMSGRYQMMLDVYEGFNGANRNVGGSGLASRQSWLANYEIQMRYLQDIGHALSYEPPVRFNKVRNRIYLDMEWDQLMEGDYLVFECRQAVDPDVYPDIWLDKWLRDYSVALAKIQWGSNLLKYSGVNLPGGVTLNGEVILGEGKEEKEKAETDLEGKYFGDLTPIIIG